MWVEENLFFREGKRIQKEFFIFFPMLFHPFSSRLLPSQLSAVFAFDPFKLPDFLLDKVSDPVEGIRQHHRWDLHVLLGVKNLTHRQRYRMTFSVAASNRFTLSILS